MRPAGRVKTIKSVIDMADFSPPPRGDKGQNADRQGSATSCDSTAIPPPQDPGGPGRPEPAAWQQAQRSAPFHRQAFAAIDLGTNNCRLLIARPQGENFVVVDAFSRVVRLGEGLAGSGRLSDAAMDRALGALHVCADKLKRRNVHLARSVATEACRRAENGADFIARVREQLKGRQGIGMLYYAGHGLQQRAVEHADHPSRPLCASSRSSLKPCTPGACCNCTGAT